MGRRILFDDAARAAVRRGVDQLADAVKGTLGPRGRNVLIERAHGAPTMTNDGLTIGREVELADRFENLGARLVHEAARKTSDVAGDGTTTATLLARALYSAGLGAVTAGVSPVALKRGMDRAIGAVVRDLAAQARPVMSHDDRAAVAAVAAGGDATLGALVAEAFERAGALGHVTIEEARGVDSELELVEGLEFDRGYLSAYFVTDPEEMRVVLERPLVLLAEGRLSSPADVVPALEQSIERGAPLFVVAQDIESEALATLVVNQLRGTARSCAIRGPGHGDAGRAWLEDLALLTGATVLGPLLGRRTERLEPGDLGWAERVVVRRETTTLVGGPAMRAAVAQRVGGLAREAAEASSRYDREQLEERRGRLAGGLAVIRIGGATAPVLKDRFSRAEDAVHAVRAAIAEGIVPGGGVALARARDAVDTLDLRGDAKHGARIVLEALLAPARQIADNAGEEPSLIVERMLEARGAVGYDAALGRFADLFRAGVVDPTQVVRVALQNAASIAGLLLTTEALVVEDEADAGPDAGGQGGPQGPGR